MPVWVTCFADMLGHYELRAYCDNFLCPRSLKGGTDLDIAQLMQRGYRGRIGRTRYWCTWCGKQGSVRMTVPWPVRL